MMCTSGSTTTYFVPPTREITVSGVDSIRSMRSGLSAKALPLWRVTMIMAMSVRGCSSNAVSIRDVRTVLIDRAAPMLSIHPEDDGLPDAAVTSSLGQHGDSPQGAIARTAGRGPARVCRPGPLPVGG